MYNLKYIIVLFLLFVLATSQTISQSSYISLATRQELLSFGIDPENEQQVLDSLNSSRYWLRTSLYDYCKEKKLYRALPKLKLLFQQHPYAYNHLRDRSIADRAIILWAVMEMNDSTFQNEFRMEIDSMKNSLGKDTSHFNMSLIVSDVLRFSSYLMKRHNDDYGFQTILPLYSSKDSLLKYQPPIFHLVPFYESSHKNELIPVLRLMAKECPNEFDRAGAIKGLIILGDTQLDTLAYDVARNDPNFDVRLAGQAVLREIQNPLYLQALIYAIQNETMYRFSYFEGLIRSRQPWAYKYVYDIYQNNTYPADNEAIKNALDNPYMFMPDPAIAQPVNILLDSLKNSISQMVAYNWLGDANFAKEIKNKLENAKKHLLKKDSINCYKEVREFQKKVNKIYEETIEKEKKHEKREKKFVTVEGWKFLYYNAQYIMDRLPGKKNEKDDDKEED